MQQFDVQETRLPALALEQVQHAYVVFDSDFRYVYVNREAQRLMSMDRSALLNRCAWDVFPDLAGTRVEREYRRVATERVSCSFEYYYPAWDRWFRLHGDPMDGGIIIGFRDITHEKKLEEELTLSKDILSLVGESGLIGSFRWLIPEDDMIISPEIYQMCGLPPSTRKHGVSFWYDRMHPDDRQDAADRLSARFAEWKSSLEYDFRTKHEDGSWRWVHCRAKIRYDAHGKPSLLVGINIDVTECKELEEQLRQAAVEEKRTAQALVEAELRYRNLVENCPVGLITAVISGEKRGTLSLANHAFLKMVGYSQQDFDSGHVRWDAITPPEWAEADQGAIATILTNGVVEPYEKEYIHKDGTRIPILISAATLPGSDEVATFVLDLTELRKAQKALEQRVEEFETLYSVAPVGITVSRDPECLDVRVNPALARLLDVDPSGNWSLNGANAARVPFRLLRNGQAIPVEDLPQQEASRTGRQTEPVEMEIIRADGQRAWVYGTAAPLFAEDGKVRGSIGAFFDVTRIRAADEKVRESHAHLQSLVDSNIIGVFVRKGPLIVEANDVYLNMLGYSRADLAAGGIDWLERTPPEHRDRAVAAAQECRTKGSFLPFEKEYIRRDGTRVPVFLGGTVLAYEPELTSICFVVDLTAQKNLERELQKTNQRLAHSNEELQRFAYVVAHDLQAPLRSVSGMAALLLRHFEGIIDAESRQIAGHLEASLARMRNLIADLLDYSTVSMDRPLRPVDSEALFKAALVNFETHVRETGGGILADSLPPVQADDHLTRVFQNLLDNALKYRSERPPAVHVAAKRAGGEWIFSVRDNGIGFHMRHAERIFGVFERLHGEEKFEGSGIGLATCKKLIERYGGRLWAESEPGVGSTFYFTVPAAAGEIPSGF